MIGLVALESDFNLHCPSSLSNPYVIIYNRLKGLNENQEGVDIRTECFGTTDCIEWLDPHHFIPQGRYFHDIIQVIINRPPLTTVAILNFK